MQFSFQLVAAAMIFASGLALADDLRTSLIIEGGGMPTFCPALERLVKAATINGRIRIGYLPTASSNPARSAERFIQRIGIYGVRPEDIQIIALSVKDASVQASDPAVVAQIRDCTAIFLGGGDQTRITRALLKPDGTRTAALQAIDALRQGGGVIAGTSAGAAAQSETMISISGYPDDLIDDGMDALDFGLTKSIEQPARRGLLVTRGLGLFRHGIIDQHFSQYRGRLARLTRAAIEEQIRFGFGIDEDAALAVADDGVIEVLGPGYVTIVDTTGATCRDGMLGCHISGAHITCLGHGDRFDPRTGKATIHPDKQSIRSGHESYNGNFQIPDIAGRGAVLHVLFDGLGNNTCQKQTGITLKHHGYYAHGYRHSFSKTDQTLGYEGIVHGVETSAVTRVRLDIEPVVATLRSAESGQAQDLPQGSSRQALAAISFRGIMPPDDDGRFRPHDAITRSELACAIAQTIRLELPRYQPVEITDVTAALPDSHSIALVVAAGLMPTSAGAFRPADPISRREGTMVLELLFNRYRGTIEPANNCDQSRKLLLERHIDGSLPDQPLTRAEVAGALFTIIAFPWAE